MSVQVGQAAPDFALFDTDKNKISSTDFRGKNVVLLFFPLAFSGVCTHELCSVRDNYDIYTHLNAEIIGISVDSLYVLKRFKTDYNFNFTLLSDFNKSVSTSYDSLYETFSYDMLGVTKRASFVLDKEGIVRYAEILDNPGNLPDFESIQKCLASLT